MNWNYNDVKESEDFNICKTAVLGNPHCVRTAAIAAGAGGVNQAATPWEHDCFYHAWDQFKASDYDCSLWRGK